MLRFDIGSTILCNLGPNGWKLGRVIALHYREADWPKEQVAPYQVLLESEHALIYVPEDDDRYCRHPSREDLKIARRMDALAKLPDDEDDISLGQSSDIFKEPKKLAKRQLNCSNDQIKTEIHHSNYRKGHCHCCDSCPRSWSAVELYSEHYRCATRNQVTVTQHSLNLGVIKVGEALDILVSSACPSHEGFSQCPTLVRLPPGIDFTDSGKMSGVVEFAPHRNSTYEVEFVAVSTVDWKKEDVGIVRLEVSFIVEDNIAPRDFDMNAYGKGQESARIKANRILDQLCDLWDMWEQQKLSNRETCTRMCKELDQLRTLLEHHPQLDEGKWWVYLGGFYMNVHKLLENTLFECELYLGHALTFGHPETRQLAEQNLDGCYQKRLLEAARFMWIDGIEKMMQGKWKKAVNIFQRAALKKDGWGWAVNYGDIWMSEALARLLFHASSLAKYEPTDTSEDELLNQVKTLLNQSSRRVYESGIFGDHGHPWANEISEAVSVYQNLRKDDSDLSEWLNQLKQRTLYWCALVLGGAEPFPPQPKPRLEPRFVKV